jgi:hypothetical protein
VIVLVAVCLSRRMDRRIVVTGAAAIMMIKRPALTDRHGQHPLDGYREGDYEQ